LAVKAAPEPINLSPKELETFTADLGGADAEKAYSAVWALRAAPRQSVPLLQERVQPVPAVDPEHVARLIAQLDHTDSAIRDRAAAELAKLGYRTKAVLEQALAASPAPEVRRRVTKLLDQFTGPVTAPGTLHALRAIEVLEYVGTPEARRVLEKLARGAPGALETVEAQAALQRLAKSTGRRSPAAAPPP
jgi:hypothetical protein